MPIEEINPSATKPATLTVMFFAKARNAQPIRRRLSILDPCLLYGRIAR